MSAASAPPSLAQLVASAVTELSQAVAAAKLVLAEQLENHQRLGWRPLGARALTRTLGRRLGRRRPAELADLDVTIELAETEISRSESAIRRRVSLFASHA